jgi:hypothetical protein
LALAVGRERTRLNEPGREGVGARAVGERTALASTADAAEDRTMATAAGSRQKGGVGMPIGISFVLGTAGVAVTLWLAWMALTNESVPIVGTARGALIAIAIVGMASCAVAGIGQAPVVGWTHPITVFGTVTGVLALVLAGAGLFGWDAVVQPVAGLVPVGTAVAATTERLAIGLLAALIAVKWLVGIPLAYLVGQR